MGNVAPAQAGEKEKGSEFSPSTAFGSMLAQMGWNILTHIWEEPAH